jgi:hypothetical protein
MYSPSVLLTANMMTAFPWSSFTLMPMNSVVLPMCTIQSITNKSADLQMAIDSSQPDIIIGTETWLTKDMNSSEFIPNDFEVFRRDRGSIGSVGWSIGC